MGELKMMEQDFLTTNDAVENALKTLVEQQKMLGKKNSAYIWKQRYNEGKLSHKKISEILEEAGYKKVVEEKWIYVKPQTDPPVASRKKSRGAYEGTQTPGGDRYYEKT